MNGGVSVHSAGGRVWRLLTMGWAVETIPWRFTDKEAIVPSGQTKVPVLVDDGEWIADSWTIAIRLERKYPERPSLFAGAQGLTKSITPWRTDLWRRSFHFSR